MTPVAKVALVARIWSRFVWVRANVHRKPLPEMVGRLTGPVRRTERLPIWRLSGAVERTLRIGSVRPTCLTSALVLFGLLREQGDAAELVIGLPGEGESSDAHAWVEVGGVDVGPAPGRAGHAEMARFA